MYSYWINWLFLDWGWIRRLRRRGSWSPSERASRTEWPHSSNNFPVQIVQLLYRASRWNWQIQIVSYTDCSGDAFLAIPCTISSPTHCCKRSSAFSTQCKRKVTPSYWLFIFWTTNSSPVLVRRKFVCKTSHFEQWYKFMIT